MMVVVVWLLVAAGKLMLWASGWLVERTDAFVRSGRVGDGGVEDGRRKVYFFLLGHNSSIA